ncbi:hypothetical protein FIBSPDRAFT_99750 [Athelia psychrophila]|uniref:Uncharacterized protein n=1 Tax=Athelia psychrophila TaxID=1759441 RepID=A0A166DMQ4_9AGAM|nr:hypothetical protein FIBSPDRAFT_99750 [Fibularhizoctonia sp. CBS 109695]
MSATKSTSTSDTIPPIMNLSLHNNGGGSSRGLKTSMCHRNSWSFFTSNSPSHLQSKTTLSTQFSDSKYPHISSIYIPQFPQFLLLDYISVPVFILPHIHLPIRHTHIYLVYPHHL